MAAATREGEGSTLTTDSDSLRRPEKAIRFVRMAFVRSRASVDRMLGAEAQYGNAPHGVSADPQQSPPRAYATANRSVAERPVSDNVVIFGSSFGRHRSPIVEPKLVCGQLGNDNGMAIHPSSWRSERRPDDNQTSYHHTPRLHHRDGLRWRLAVRPVGRLRRRTVAARAARPGPRRRSRRRRPRRRTRRTWRGSRRTECGRFQPHDRRIHRALPSARRHGSPAPAHPRAGS